MTHAAKVTPSTLMRVWAILVVGTACTQAIGQPVSQAQSGGSNSSPTGSEARLLLRARVNTETILSAGQGRPYRILLSVPQGPPPPGGFPVIYVLDGDAWFAMALQIARMREYETLAPAVIVGVAYPSHYFFDAKRRTFDFTPPRSTDSDMQAARIELGGAAQFLSFIDGILKPWVRTSCSCMPGTQVLFGHSLGGLFVLYAMFEKPDSFQVYLAASPSIFFSKRIVLKGEPAFEQNAARKVPRVLLTVGEYEYPKASEALMADYRRYYTTHPEEIPGETATQAVNELFGKQPEDFNMRDDARSLAIRLARHGARVTFTEFPGEEHTSAAVCALNRGIPFALRPEPAHPTG